MSKLVRILLILLIAPGALVGQQVTLDQLRDLEFRHIGPVGNRISSVAGVVGDPLTYYAGAAAGGVWKSVDGGEYWEPIFDGYEDHAIGALAVSRSDPAIVWAGTGEPHIRSNVSIGSGIYKSTDAGKTWRRAGLQFPSRTSSIVIHPANPDVVYVGALGHVHGPQRERGVFRTRDGGATWEHVLFVDENTGASSVVMDPNNPRILFAGMWTVVFNTWGRESGGPGSGIYMSRDAGDTWKKLEGNGLPILPVGKVDICMTPANSDRVYALIETGDGVPWHGRETESGELWRSDDGGDTWQLMTHDRNFGGRTGYYNNCVVFPDDPDEAFFLTSQLTRSIDGGRTGQPQTGRGRPGGDYHDLWIDPSNADRIILGNDQGVSVSINRGWTWHRTQLPAAQMYHVTADNAIPYNVMGNRQDGPSFRGPSNTRAGGIPRGEWFSVGGGESGFATPDPTDHNVVWSSASGSGARGGIVVRYNALNRQFRQVEVWPENTGGWPAEGLRYRFQWTFPLLISPHDNNTVYVTSQHVHRTTNGGQSWAEISPDLTTNNKARQGISGGLTPDNIGVEYCCVIYAFDESPAQAGVLWAGSNDGLVHVSRDNGANWTNVTGNMPNMPVDGVVRSIDASRWSAGKAYLTIEAHNQGDFEPYAYKTENFGQRWTKIVDGIAESPLSYARYLLEDPVRPGLLYLGTENALYVSFDDGDNWQSIMTNLPSAPMYGLWVQEHFNDLVVGTYGRGFWILDDLSALQQLTDQVVASGAHLFEPRSAYRFRSRTSAQSMPNDPSAGRDPPNGAAINYWLGSMPSGPVSIHIADGSGERIRTLDGSKKLGINRVWWNFQDESVGQIRMRTKPLYADWVDLGEDGWRSGGGGISLTMPPGTYTVTLEVDGNSMSQQLEVLKDPNSEGSLQDIQKQLAFVSDVRDDYVEAARLINRVEWVRKQMYDMKPVFEDQAGFETIIATASKLDSDLIEVEQKLVRMTTTGTGQDGVRYPTMVAGRLRYLAGAAATADFPPTDQMGEVHRVLAAQLQEYGAELEPLLGGRLQEFNAMLQEKGMRPVF